MCLFRGRLLIHQVDDDDGGLFTWESGFRQRPRSGRDEACGVHMNLSLTHYPHYVLMSSNLVNSELQFSSGKIIPVTLLTCTVVHHNFGVQIKKLVAY